MNNDERDKEKAADTIKRHNVDIQKIIGIHLIRINSDTSKKIESCTYYIYYKFD